MEKNTLNTNSDASKSEQQIAKKIIRDIAVIPDDEIDIDLLIEYVLSQVQPASDSFSKSPMSEGDIFFIKEMIASSVKWRSVYEELLEVHQRLQRSLFEKGILPQGVEHQATIEYGQSKFINKVKQILHEILDFLKHKKSRFVFASFAAIILVYFSLYLITHQKEEPYYTLALDTSFILSTRSSNDDSDDLQAMKVQFALSDYPKVIELGEQIRANASEPVEIVVIDQLLAAGYVQNSPRSFLGLFPYYDQMKLRRAIWCSEDALQKIKMSTLTVDEKKSVEESSFLMMANAYVLLDDFDKAKECLEQVIKLNGNYLSEASHFRDVINLYRK